MEEIVKYNLNRRVNMIVNLTEILDKGREPAFVLERDVVRLESIIKIKVGVTSGAVKALQNQRAGIIEALNTNTSMKGIYKKAQEGLIIEVQSCQDDGSGMTEGVLTIAGYYLGNDDVISIRRSTFETILKYVDNNFNLDDEYFDETSVVEQLERKAKASRKQR